MFKKAANLLKNPLGSNLVVPTEMKVEVEPIEFHNARGMNFFRIAFWTDTSARQKPKLLEKAWKGLCKAIALIEDPDSGEVLEERKAIIYCNRATIRFYRVVNDPIHFDEYFNFHWERVRLLLLGSRDPGSILFALQDADFLWHIIRAFFTESELNTDIQFPGLNISPHVVTEMALALNDIQHYRYSTARVFWKVESYCEYFTRTEETSLASVYNISSASLNPYWRAIDTLVDGETMSLKFNITFHGLPDNVPKEFHTLPCYTTAYSIGLLGGNGHVEFNWTTGEFYVFCRKGAHEFSAHLKRLGNQCFDTSFSGNVMLSFSNGVPIQTLEARVTFTFFREEAEGRLKKWLLEARNPDHVDSEENGEKLILQAQPSHHFKSLRLNRPHWCKHCGHHIKSWGLQNHFQCKTCDMIVHNKCQDKVVKTCYKKVVS
eukprot:TRINITY_DN1969_c0_g1_i1.p1 TRINITY_DN1969_c0_g1~~TRINITY_DN1969_c0_g1_i1.p1  ORF type:complete len:433 (-),score=39.12 TRINITY_DN1969_c0_g1_i1:81-1379(-)